MMWLYVMTSETDAMLRKFFDVTKNFLSSKIHCSCLQVTEIGKTKETKGTYSSLGKTLIQVQNILGSAAFKSCYDLKLCNKKGFTKKTDLHKQFFKKKDYYPVSNYN